MARYTTPTHRKIEAEFFRRFGQEGTAITNHGGEWFIEVATAGGWPRTWAVDAPRGLDHVTTCVPSGLDFEEI